jgi:hypothetical protein
MKDYKQEFFKLLMLLESGDPFAFARFSDGERTIMKNKRLVLAEDHFIQGDIYGNSAVTAPIPYMEEERKDFDPERDSFFRDKLMEAYLFKKNNYFKGIAGSNEWGGKEFEYCISEYGEDDHEHLTFSNVFINGNYSLFVNMMIPEFKNKDVILVCNKNATLDSLPFKVKKDFRIGSNCMVNDYHLIEEMKQYISDNNIKDHVFLFSAATLSNFLIYELYKDFDQNQYIDIGSSLSPLLGLQGWRGTRVYLRCYWEGEQNSIINQEDSWG